MKNQIIPEELYFLFQRNLVIEYAREDVSYCLPASMPDINRTFTILRWWIAGTLNITANE